MKILSCQGTGLVLLTILAACTVCWADDGPGAAPDKVAARNLEWFGIATSTDSLIAALEHTNYTAASSAAILLGYKPKSKEIVSALIKLAEAGPPGNSFSPTQKDGMVMHAIRSLMLLQEESWIPAAKKWYPQIKHPNSKMLLVFELAQAGHTDGWAVVVRYLEDPVFCGTALKRLELFDQKKTNDGKTIDVVAELKARLEKVPEANRKAIQAKIEELTKRRKNGQ